MTILAGAMPAHAINGSMTVITTNSYIPDASTICSFAQDSVGMVWVGTENGLYSYDGYGYIPHYIIKGKSNTRIHSICTFGSKLYLGTDNGLLIYDYMRDCYEDVDGGPTDVRALLGGDAAKAVGLTGGNVPQKSSNTDEMGKNQQQSEVGCLIIGSAQGVFVYDISARNFTPLSKDVRRIYSMAVCGKRLLAGTISGLYDIDIKSGKAKKINIGGGNKLVNALNMDSINQCLWVGTEGALYKKSLDADVFTQIPGLDGNSVKALITGKDGMLHIGTDAGAYTYSKEGTLKHYVHDSRYPNSLANNIVWALFLDRWNNLWAGTDNGITISTLPTYYSYVAVDDITGTGEGNCFHAMLHDRTGRIWLGGTNGLIAYDVPKGMSMSRTDMAGNMSWFRQDNGKNYMSHNRVRKVYEDADGDIWIATDHGINLYDRTTGQLRNFIISDESGKYSKAWAYDIIMDSRHRLWVSAYMGGIFIVDKNALIASDGRYTAPVHIDDAKGGLTSIHVGQMADDGKGNIWAMIYDKGIDYIDQKTLKVKHVTENRRINNMVPDKDGNIWLAYNGGIEKYTSPDADPLVYEMYDGSTPENIISITVDGKDVWAMTTQKCYVVSGLNRVMSFAIPFVRANTSCRSDISGNIIIGGNDGVLIVNPAKTIKAYKQQMIVLSDVDVNGKRWAMDAEGYHTGDGSSLRFAREIILSHDKNNLVFHLSNLPYSNGPAVTYIYKMEGVDKHWQYMQPQRNEISYSGLPYGDYRLVLCTSESGGEKSGEVYSLNVRILPPWYLSTWAKTIYIIVFIILTVFLVNFIKVRRRLKMERRKHEEEMRQAKEKIAFFENFSTSLEQPLPEITPKKLVEENEVKADDNADNPAKSSDATEQIDPADKKLLDEIVAAIEKHIYDSDFNVTRMQDVLGIGDKMLYRKIKQLTGMTPVEYIRYIRMKRAAMLLRQGKFAVSEVMYMVGFSNSGYFSKCFHKEFGMTPTEYSKQNDA